MPYNVFDIANKLLHRASMSVSEELMSNMKLQKMLYYQQGFHLAYFGTPLFEEEIEAWRYGPVVPCVYSHFKIHGGSGISPERDEISLTKDEEAVFSQVFNLYNVYSAIGLMNLTHAESPWLSVSAERGSVISKESMKAFFDTRLQ